MKQKFTHPLSGKIWNTTFGSNYCVLETRNEDTRQVSFSCINLLTGNILWKNIQPEKSWWLGLVGIFDNYLFLHKYSSKQKPEPEGLLVLNVRTGEVIEKLNDWTFFEYQESILTIYQIENNQPVYQNLNVTESSLKTTEGAMNLTPSPSPMERGAFDLKNSPLHRRGAGGEVVTHYPEDSPHFPTIYKFLYRLLNIDAVKAVDYLEISNKIIISYYIYRENLFQNYLLVTNREREILLHDIIAETEGIGIDTFTVKSDTLLYVKNENQFIGYEL